MGELEDFGHVCGSLCDVVWVSLRILACNLGWETESVDDWVSGCDYVEV